MIKKLIILIIFFPIFYFSQTIAKVVAIKDGDTIVILLHDKSQKTLRLAEVDCPESGQPFGKNAKQFTSSQVFSKNIQFIETNIDQYGRTIAKVYYDNKYLSEEIIKNGYGWWFFKYSKNIKLRELQNYAMSNKIGLWSDPNAIAPWEWRKINK